jgi:hypothetical protein
MSRTIHQGGHRASTTHNAWDWGSYILKGGLHSFHGTGRQWDERDVYGVTTWCCRHRYYIRHGLGVAFCTFLDL